MSKEPPTALKAGPRWPWVVLGLGLVWTAWIRVPLVLNAEDHLDSDLAVDGLSLLDAMRGHWRWHYPGTPHMGILPVLTSYPQAVLWGASAVTLASGGTLMWLAVAAATFWLASKAYGRVVAAWAIMPLVFSSIGTIWLSGRITGGHLLTLVWHTLALVGLHGCVSRGGWLRSMMLGLWCGLGLYLDAMFLLTLAGLIVAAVLAWFSAGSSRRALVAAAVFLIGLGIGLLPREIGRRVDRHDAYPAQFGVSLESQVVFDHARLLALRCLPRLIAGIELVDLDEWFAAREGGGDPIHTVWGRDVDPVLPSPAEWLAIVFLIGLTVAFLRLVLDPLWTGEAARKAVGGGVAISALLIAGSFLVNSNIFDSDNYRYLIYFLTPWSLGYGLLMHDLVRQGRFGRLIAVLCAGLLMGVMTAAAFYWYQVDRGYVDGRGLPIRRRVACWRELAVEMPVSSRSTSAVRTYTIPPEVTHVLGGYWDVYRIAFLSGGRIRGIPYPIYPNRFRGWSRGLAPSRGALLVLPPYRESRAGSPQVAVGRMGRRKPRPIPASTRSDWFGPLSTVWKADGRNPAELKGLHVIVPSLEPARR
jgi:hypothetical protein